MFRAIIILTVCEILYPLHGHNLAVRNSLSLQPFDLEDDSISAYGTLYRKQHQGSRGLISNAIGHVVSSTGNAALSMAKFGRKFAMLPLHGVKWVTTKAATSVMGLKMKLLKSIANMVKSTWKKAIAIEFPGKSLVALVFPNAIVAIVDRLTNRVMTFATRTKEAIKATVAYALYAALTMVSSAVTSAAKALGFDCFPVNKVNLEPHILVIDSIEISEGSICGLSHLQPTNNVTITRDKGTRMVISMPWVLRNLRINVKSVDVSGVFGSIMKGQPVEIIVGEILLQETVSFSKSSFLMFEGIHFECGNVTGINIKLEGASEDSAAGVLNSLAGALAVLVQTHINNKLLEVEKIVSDTIMGKSRH